MPIQGPNTGGAVSVGDILEHHTNEIASILEIPASDQITLTRIQNFVACNGYPGLRDAAEETRDTNATGREIPNKWPHAVGVFNGMIGRSGLLYQLLHLLETSLRARVSLSFEAVHGEAWHLDLPRLLEPWEFQRIKEDLERHLG